MSDQKSFEWKGRCGPFELLLSEHTFAPSSVSRFIGDVMDVQEGETVIDMGCGSGVLSIVAARLGAGRVYGVDSAPDTDAVASRNAERHGVGEVTSFLCGDLFAPLPNDLKADLLIGDVSGIPDPVARVSGWFPTGTGGGPRGSELPIRMLREAPAWLRPGGRLLLPTGTLQDEAAILDVARSIFQSITQRVEKRLPLPSTLAETPEVVQLMNDRVIDLTPRGSRMLWEARVWECRLAE